MRERACESNRGWGGTANTWRDGGSNEEEQCHPTLPDIQEGLHPFVVPPFCTTSSYFARRVASPQIVTEFAFLYTLFFMFPPTFFFFWNRIELESYIHIRYDMNYRWGARVLFCFFLAFFRHLDTHLHTFCFFFLFEFYGVYTALGASVCVCSPVQPHWTTKTFFFHVTPISVAV